MGLNHSGSVADTCFYLLCELTWALNPPIREQHGVLAYFRFRDDILIIFGAFQSLEFGAGHFLKGLQARSGFYTVEIEEFSKVSVPMLNVLVEIDDGKLRTDHYSKPTSVESIPLCTSSMHAPGVHSSWPKAYLSSILSLCDSVAKKNRLKRTFLNSFKNNGVTVPSLSSTCRKVVVPEQSSEDIWLPLPYHPLLRVALTRAVIKVNSSELSLAAYSSAYGGLRQQPRIRIAWRNAFPPNWRRVRVSNAKVLKKSGDVRAIVVA